MYTRLKKRFSIATCLFFILISCVITPQGPNRLAANEEGKHRQKSLSYDVWLNVTNDENLKHLENGNTKGFEQEKLWQYNFGKNGAIASSLTRFDDREEIDATVRQKENNCTAIGNLGHPLNQDCATMAIYLKGAIRWQSAEDSPPNLRLKLL